MVPSKDAVEDVHCADANEFLDTLIPRRKPWCNDPAQWIYRGQGNAEWELRPTALRDVRAFARCGGPVLSQVHVFEVIGALNDQLDRFQVDLERMGIEIPMPGPVLHHRKLHPTNSSNAQVAPERFPLMALAQHHGLPTTFLDWTRRSFVAAYFAAKQALYGPSPEAPAYLVVWALRLEGHGGRGVDVYEAPTSTNPNLQAQAGLFTYLTTLENHSLEAFYARLLQDYSISGCLRRVMLPSTRAGELLRLLSREGVDGASMFPGPDGVVRAMCERAQW